MHFVFVKIYRHIYRKWVSLIDSKCWNTVIISRGALARQGDYEMMSVLACVRVCVRALVSHADFSKTTTATVFL